MYNRPNSAPFPMHSAINWLAISGSATDNKPRIMDNQHSAFINRQSSIYNRQFHV